MLPPFPGKSGSQGGKKKELPFLTHAMQTSLQNILQCLPSDTKFWYIFRCHFWYSGWATMHKTTVTETRPQEIKERHENICWSIVLCMVTQPEHRKWAITVHTGTSASVASLICAIGSFGITSTWIGATGFTSRNAIAWKKDGFKQIAECIQIICESKST